MNNVVGKDLFMNAWGFALLLMFLMLAFIQDPQTPAKPTVTPPGDLMVCIYWTGNDDVDLWGGPPGQPKATGYSHKNGEVLDLVRDDLGKDANTRPRTECQFARGLPDGRWAFNLHGFHIIEPEVMVHAEIRLGGEFGFSLLLERDLTIKQAQERTIAQFQLAGGKVVPGSVNEVYVPLRSAQ